MEARLANVKLAMADTRKGLDLIEQGMEKGLEDLREQIQDLCEGMLLTSSTGVTRGVHVLPRQGHEHVRYCGVNGGGLGCAHGGLRPGDSTRASHL